ncbi:hypothetical protein CBR69_22365 [Bordetella hinzii]|nr:hypothetical protein CBR69_22365 [Bordetella hinzii]
MRRALPAARLRLREAAVWHRRLLGLLGRRRAPGPRSGLLLRPCHAVHTMGMAYPIAVWFIGRDGRVLQARRLDPWRWASCRGAVAVVETRVEILDAEDGGIGRVEAAVEHRAGRHVDGDLHDVGDRGRDADGDQQAGAQVDEQEHHDPDGAVDQEGPFIAPAGHAREEQRLHHAQSMPGHQHGRMPEERGDDDVEDGKQEQRDAHGGHEGHDVVLDLDGPQPLGQVTPEGQEGKQAAGQAQAGIQQPHEEELAKNPGAQQRFGPHGGQHDSPGLDVLAGRQRHQGEHRHQRDEQ